MDKVIQISALNLIRNSFQCNFFFATDFSLEIKALKTFTNRLVYSSLPKLLTLWFNSFCSTCPFFQYIYSRKKARQKKEQGAKLNYLPLCENLYRIVITDCFYFNEYTDRIKSVKNLNLFQLNVEKVFIICTRIKIFLNYNVFQTSLQLQK